ncbi:MAG: hypothetical protein UGF89_08670 [Acutalibacteraceae bacterium]|nr:hypothetical protein [Acutalibacteraceae bacterium]
MKQWNYVYGDNCICVKNKDFNGEELYVNGELQDKNPVGGFCLAELSGELKTGEKIKVKIGGFWRIDCCLFINNVLQYPVHNKKCDFGAINSERSDKVAENF